MTSDLDHTSVSDLITEGLHTQLNTKLYIEPDDAAKAGIVRPGRLQADPTKTRISVTIHPGGEDWPDELNTQAKGPGIHSPTYVLGGSNAAYGHSQYWRRRFIIEFNIFFTSVNRATTRKRAQVVFSRAAHALITWDIGAVVARDSFGEKPFFLQVSEIWMSEGGGDDNFNWRGEIYIECLTDYEPTDV